MTMKSQAVSMYTAEGRILARFPSVRTASEVIQNADQSHIRKVCRGDRKAAGGYAWKYVKVFSENRLHPRVEGVRQYTPDGQLVGIYADHSVASAITGVSAATISRATQTGRVNKGFRWK